MSWHRICGTSTTFLFFTFETKGYSSQIFCRLHVSLFSLHVFSFWLNQIGIKVICNFALILSESNKLLLICIINFSNIFGSIAVTNKQSLNAASKMNTKFNETLLKNVHSKSYVKQILKLSWILVSMKILHKTFLVQYYFVIAWQYWNTVFITGLSSFICQGPKFISLIFWLKWQSNQNKLFALIRVLLYRLFGFICSSIWNLCNQSNYITHQKWLKYVLSRRFHIRNQMLWIHSINYIRSWMWNVKLIGNGPQIQSLIHH